MKKLLVLLMSIILVFCCVGCKRDTDLEEITKDGKILIGITDYQPINYKVDGKWTGFDTELARLFAQELSVEAKFVEIKWADKYTLLDEYEIDCIWNATTLIEEYQSNYSVSNPYIYCNQILVMKADVVNNYHNGYDVRKLRFVAEKGSSGDACILREGYKQTNMLESQYAALEAVANGEADCAIVDDIFANQFVGKGKKYSNLATGFNYSEEGAGVVFRKNSDLTKRFNDFLDRIRDEELINLANKYGLTLY